LKFFQFEHSESLCFGTTFSIILAPSLIQRETTGNRINSGLPGAAAFLAASVTALVSLLYLSPSAVAQVVVTPGASVFTQQIAQTVNPSTAIPTDLVHPLPGQPSALGDRLQFKLLQKLPTRFYFLGVTEISLRDETNVFQTASRAHMLRAASGGDSFGLLTTDQQNSVLQSASIASRNDGVFRILPNVTAGWALTPKTRVFANYFLLRDQLFHNVAVNTLIESIGGGIQHDFQMGRKGNLQATFQARELYQNKVHNVFDYLPGITYTRVVTPHSIAFASVLLQLRGKQFIVAPNREIDPFYSVGAVYQKGAWQFSHATTFLQNFRQPFAGNALIPVNNYSFVLDFEVARRVHKKLPGLQAFVRAEPIFNMHSNATPGLSGVDFRIFGGLRLTLSKPSLLPAVKNIDRQFDEQEVNPPPPVSAPSQFQPSVTAPVRSQIDNGNSPAQAGLRPAISPAPSAIPLTSQGLQPAQPAEESKAQLRTPVATNTAPQQL
jgi:hypothetical protein